MDDYTVEVCSGCGDTYHCHRDCEVERDRHEYLESEHVKDLEHIKKLEERIAELEKVIREASFRVVEDKATGDVLEEVACERGRQRAIFGDQTGLDDLIWNCVLVEEVGEVSTALHDPNKEVDSLEEELIQVAGVAVAWVEKIRAKKLLAVSSPESAEEAPLEP